MWMSSLLLLPQVQTLSSAPNISCISEKRGSLKSAKTARLHTNLLWHRNHPLNRKTCLGIAACDNIVMRESRHLGKGRKPWLARQHTWGAPCGAEERSFVVSGMISRSNGGIHKMQFGVCLAICHFSLQKCSSIKSVFGNGVIEEK